MKETSHSVVANCKLFAGQHYSENQEAVISFASITSNSACNTFSPRRSKDQNSCFIEVPDKWMDNFATRDYTKSSMGDCFKEPWIGDHNYNSVPESETDDHNYHRKDGDVCFSRDQSYNIKQGRISPIPPMLKKRRSSEGNLVKENVKIPCSRKEVNRMKLVTDVKENAKKPKLLMKFKKREKWILKDTPSPFKKIFTKIQVQEKQVDTCLVKLAQSKLIPILLNKPSGLSKKPHNLFEEEIKGGVNSCQSNSLSLKTDKTLESIKPSDTSSREDSIIEVNANIKGIEKSSVRLMKNGKQMDFRCTICQELPRKLNKSELYRHYSVQHFSKELSEQFGGYKVCPYCKLEFKGGSNASHFGQKHCLVEMFLPTEAWIPEQWNRTYGNKKYKNFVKMSAAPQLFFEWPEIPAGFDPDGGIRICGTKKGSSSGKVQNTIIVEGFKIEFEKDDEKFY